MDNKGFTILRQGVYFMMDDCPRYLPWAAIEPFNHAALNHYGRSLQELDKWGGLKPCEIYAVIHNKAHKEMDPQTAVDFVKTLVPSARNYTLKRISRTRE